jgi:hypothetical protein
MRRLYEFKLLIFIFLEIVFCVKVVIIKMQTISKCLIKTGKISLFFDYFIANLLILLFEIMV